MKSGKDCLLAVESGEEEEKSSTESPESVKLSLASAMALDLRPGLFYRNAQNPCINILLNYKSGCVARCAYCGLSKAREGEYNEKSFIKVEWPVYSVDEVVRKMSEKKARLKRICISMITEKRAVPDTKTILKKITDSVDMPVSVLLSPTIITRSDMEEIKALGADRVGIAVDAANENIFDRYRGSAVKGPHKWAHYWKTVEDALSVFGRGNVGLHMIVGLGETEREFVGIMLKARNMGAMTHLFSFFAEKGSPLEGISEPSMSKYRRMQLARYLIDEESVPDSSFTFREDGTLSGYGIPQRRIEEIIENGLPFMTTGCRGRDGKVACNRPYGDSLPGDNIRSYPFMPEEKDVCRIKKQFFE